MTDKVHIVFVTGELDWQGLYIDGILEFEDQRIPTFTVLEFLVGKTVASYKEIEYDSEWMEEEGSLPIELSTVKVAE